MTAPEPQVLLTPGEVAGLHGVTVRAVAKWANAGRVTAVRTPGGHRRYPSDQFADVLAYRTQEVQS